MLLAGWKSLNRCLITAAVTFSHLRGLLNLPFWARVAVWVRTRLFMIRYDSRSGRNSMYLSTSMSREFGCALGGQWSGYG